jgi:cytochrome c oxidase subunit IV
MSDHEHHESHAGAYLAVFIALCGFTAVSVVADLMHIPNRVVLVAIVLAVATAKALCVMLYFMHLKFERAWKYMLLAPTFILAAGMMIALIPDIGEHYYTVDSPQVHEYENDLKHGEQPASEHH